MDGTSSPKPPINVSNESVPSVMPRFRLAVSPNVEQTKVKCDKCGTNTDHDWTMLSPVDELNLMSMVEIAPMAKRVLLCKVCGNVRVVK